MNITKAIKKLCTPAYVYLVMSMISIIILMAQNAGNDTKFCIGSYTCKVMSTSFVFFCQALYTAIWTFILDSVCKKGYNNISWFLVLFPYLLFFIIIGLFILGDKKKEGFKEGKTAMAGWQNSMSGTSSPSSASPSGEDSSSVKKSKCTSLSKTHCNSKDGCAWIHSGVVPACYDDKVQCMNSSGELCSGKGKCKTFVGGGPGRCKCNCGWYGEFCEQIGCRETQCGGKTKEEKKSNLAACKKLTAGREKAAAAAKK